MKEDLHKHLVKLRQQFERQKEQAIMTQGAIQLAETLLLELEEKEEEGSKDGTKDNVS